MSLVIRIFDEAQTGPQVLVSTKKKPHHKCRDKVIRNSDDKPLRGLLAAMVEYDELAADLDLLAQAAFDLGREYATQKKK